MGRMTLSVPGGDGDGHNEVVVGAGLGGVGGSGAQVEKFVFEDGALWELIGPAENLVIEEENEVGNKVAAGHGFVAVGGVAGGCTAGDEHGEDFGVEMGAAEFVDDGRAGAAGVDDKKDTGSVGGVDLPQTAGDELGILGVTGSERVTAEAAEVEGGIPDVLESEGVMAGTRPEKIE